MNDVDKITKNISHLNEKTQVDGLTGIYNREACERLVDDHLLMEFASILNQFFAHKDIVSRLGGDEFIVFMITDNLYDL